ncbi:MAG: TauD/TfdA family dioxygenase [Pseudomonas sp.]
MAGIEFESPSYIKKIQFSKQQARLLDLGSRQTAAVGGPDATGAAAISAHHAKSLKSSMDTRQLDIIESFSCGKAAAVEFIAMQPPSLDPIPESLPTIAIISTDPITLYLASRNQILLNLVNYRSFAFDIDNGSKQVRLVGNFKGGGENLLADELKYTEAELSSHSGVKLGPHTEPPYNCAVKSEGEHSPAPSALILTARWNPLHEPTRLIPVRSVVAKLNGLEALALSSKSFCFTRSDCFVKDDSKKMVENSILQFDPRGEFTLRYSSYRYSLLNEADQSTRQAYHSLQRLLKEAKSYTFQLHPGSALLINNNQTLHAREIIKDNRRLLIRLFGYSPDAQPLIWQQDPLVVRD